MYVVIKIPIKTYYSDEKTKEEKELSWKFPNILRLGP